MLNSVDRRRVYFRVNGTKACNSCANLDAQMKKVVIVLLFKIEMSLHSHAFVSVLL